MNFFENLDFNEVCQTPRMIVNLLFVKHFINGSALTI